MITTIKKEAFNPHILFMIRDLIIFNIKPDETKKIKFGFNVTLPEDLITVDIK